MRDPKQLFGYFFSPACEILSCDVFDNEVASMSWKRTKECYKHLGNTNIFIACFHHCLCTLKVIRTARQVARLVPVPQHGFCDTCEL